MRGFSLWKKGGIVDVFFIRYVSCSYAVSCEFFYKDLKSFVADSKKNRIFALSVMCAITA